MMTLLPSRRLVICVRWVRAMAVPFFLVIGLSERIAAQELTPKPPINASELRPDYPWPDDPFAPDPTQPRRDDDVAPASWERVGDLSSLGSIKYRSAMTAAPPPPEVPDKAWSYGPQDLHKYLISAETHRMLGSFERALVYYDAAIRCDPKSLPAHFGRACILTEQDKVEDVKKELDGVLRRQPDHAGAYALRGLIRVDQSGGSDPSALEVALADVRRAIELSPEEPRARLARGMLAIGKHDYDAAIVDLTWEVEHHVDPVAALSFRGLAYLRKGEFDRALADLTEAERSCNGIGAAVRSNSPLSPSMVRLARYYCQNSWNRGLCYANKCQFDRAIEEFSVAIDHYSEGAEIYGARSQAYWMNGDLDHALADIEQFIRLCPEEPRGYVQRSNLLFNKGEFDRLQSDLDHLVQLCPKECGPYFIRAVLTTLARQDWDHAVADMDRALTIDPGVCPFYLFRGVLNARNAKLLPTCRDLAAFFLTLQRTELQFNCKIELPTETKLGRFWIGIGWRSKRDSKKPQPERPGLNVNAQCIDLGMERLAAATFGITR
jgi:tetratricopeptide (TPR) repeat protein